MTDENIKTMTDEQFREWLQTDEGGFWLAEQLKKKLLEVDQLRKLGRERLKVKR